MINPFRKILSDKKIEEIEKAVISASDDGKIDIAWKSLQPLLKAQKTQEAAAISLTRIVEDQYLPVEQSLEVLSSVYAEHKNKVNIVSLIGSALEGARDIDQLNLSPPDHQLFRTVIDDLVKASESPDGQDEEVILNGLSTATRMMARQYDSVAENSYRRLVEIDPEYPSYHYCLGLFYKTRGLFKEGVVANQKASGLVDEPVDSYQWNLGICATGAGEGEVALDVWKRLGNKVDMGRFNLPEGGYPQCKVKLAERPLAERDATNDDPGLEETIWIERLSPCHGIIRSVLFQDLGLDYGDVVLIDGAPITYHKYGEKQIPVFPHLATLVKNNYLFFDFAATQEEKGQIDGISQTLGKDAIVYVHTENYQVLCATCWQDSSVDHTDHKKEQKNIVTGRIAAPCDMSPQDLLSAIDDALSSLEHCKIFAPELCEKAGFDERAEVERRRFDMLVGN
jgi:hypothetical protein